MLMWKSVTKENNKIPDPKVKLLIKPLVENQPKLVMFRESKKLK